MMKTCNTGLTSYSPTAITHFHEHSEILELTALGHNTITEDAL
jgi:hypothetical protein